MGALRRLYLLTRIVRHGLDHIPWECFNTFAVCHLCIPDFPEPYDCINCTRGQFQPDLLYPDRWSVEETTDLWVCRGCYKAERERMWRIVDAFIDHDFSQAGNVDHIERLCDVCACEMVSWAEIKHQRICGHCRGEYELAETATWVEPCDTVLRRLLLPVKSIC